MKVSNPSQTDGNSSMQLWSSHICSFAAFQHAVCPLSLAFGRYSWIAGVTPSLPTASGWAMRARILSSSQMRSSFSVSSGFPGAGWNFGGFPLGAGVAAVADAA